jgi:circadian clock protein KaiB
MSKDFVALRLYVAGKGANSTQAIVNLEALCREHLPERHGIEIVDVFQEPGRALADGVLLTPSLVVLASDPPTVIVGTLSDPEVLLRVLRLESLHIA